MNVKMKLWATPCIFCCLVHFTILFKRNVIWRIRNFIGGAGILWLRMYVLQYKMEIHQIGLIGDLCDMTMYKISEKLFVLG